MKRIGLAFKLWWAGYRAHRALWWLMAVTLVGCCGMFLYVFLQPYLEARCSVYYNLTNMHTQITIYGTATEEELADVYEALSKSRVVDYYMPKKRLEQPVQDMIGSVSTVVPVRLSLYAFQYSDMLCQSRHGEPLDGYMYLNTKYTFQYMLPFVQNDEVQADSLTLRYQCGIWGDELFDMLISEGDFQKLDRPVSSLLYGISPTATMADVEALNERLAQLLPQKKIKCKVTMDKSLGVSSHAWWYYVRDIGVGGVVFACIIIWALLFHYQLQLRGRDLTVARLVGCRRWQQFFMLVVEGLLNAVLTFVLTMGGYSLYRLLFVREAPRIIWQLWGDVWPVAAFITVVGAAVGVLVALTTLWRPLPLAGKDGSL